MPIVDPSSQPYPYRTMFESLTGDDDLPKKNIHPQLMNHERDVIGDAKFYQTLTDEAINCFKNLARQS